MYGIVEAGGKQVRVTPAESVQIPKVQGEPGDKIELSTVLMCRDGDTLYLGTPYVEGAVVRAAIISHERGPKIRGMKFKRRKKYRRRWGHRQDYTVIQIEEVSIPEEIQK
jgi:large subunit ribosomal protein L21